MRTRSDRTATSLDGRARSSDRVAHGLQAGHGKTQFVRGFAGAGEALELPAARHHDTFERNGNLFGAAIPVNLEAAIRAGKLDDGGLVALGGFAHAGDYAAGAVIRWPAKA